MFVWILSVKRCPVHGLFMVGTPEMAKLIMKCSSGAQTELKDLMLLIVHYECIVVLFVALMFYLFEVNNSDLF